jgi:protein-L-isoaspartate(D-aspartate) O-methyltransferase
MAIMLDQLDLAPGQRVLEIGAGTGYNAALIRHIVGRSGTVVTVDIDREVTEAAGGHLADAGYPDVTVACGDGADGWPDEAPYDRVIATVGVSDLAPAWLEQARPDARIVVPLDVRGMQLSVAFTRAGAHWASRSLAPCGFMRMRGPHAGPERLIALAPGLTATFPDGDRPGIDRAALAAAVAGPPVSVPTGVQALAARVFWGLGLWLAASEPRSCKVDEEWPAAGRGGQTAWLARAPLRSFSQGGRGVLASTGIADSGGIAVITTAPPQATEPSGLLTLEADGFGPRGPALAAELAGHVRAWDAAGQPGTAGLRVDAYPRPVPAPAPAEGTLLIERPRTMFLVGRT